MARYFDGTSGHIEIADHAVLTWPGLVSIGGWFRVNGGATSAIYALPTWGVASATPSVSFWYFGPSHPGAANKILTTIKSDGGNVTQKYSADDLVVLNTWHHLALTIENSEVWGKLFRFYLDGVENWSTDFATMDSLNAATNWLFGDAQTPALHWPGDVAEWAKWDSVLSAEQITALANGVRPPEVGTRPAWYVPMLAGLEEEIAGLTVTNYGTTIADHPPAIISPGSPYVLQTIWPVIAGPYQVSAAATHASGTADGRVFSTGTMIGQVNEQ